MRVQNNAEEMFTSMVFFAWNLSYIYTYRKHFIVLYLHFPVSLCYNKLDQISIIFCSIHFVNGVLLRCKGGLHNYIQNENNLKMYMYLVFNWAIAKNYVNISNDFFNIMRWSNIKHDEIYHKALWAVLDLISLWPYLITS